MKKLLISAVDSSISKKFIKQYLHNYNLPKVREHTFGDHIVMESEMEEYVKAAYILVNVSGPCQKFINKFLKDRKIIRCLYVPKMNSLVVEEMVPNPQRIFDVKVYCISFDIGTATLVELNGASLKGVRNNTCELIVLQEEQSESLWEWSLVNLLNGKTKSIYKGGGDFYLSADGNLFFLVQNWSQIVLVDLRTGTQLDAKNKRHFSRYATKVKIIKVIDFDPSKLCFLVLLMKRQDLSFVSLKSETCIKLEVTG